MSRIEYNFIYISFIKGYSQKSVLYSHIKFKIDLEETLGSKANIT